MREEIQRILEMVRAGQISPEDGALLIEALTEGTGTGTAAREETEAAGEPNEAPPGGALPSQDAVATFTVRRDRFEIDVDADNARVELVPVQGETGRVLFQGPERCRPQVEVGEHRLAVRIRCRPSLFGLGPPRLVLELPEVAVYHGSLEVANGAFDLGRLRVVDLQLEARNGAVRGALKSAERLAIETHNGSVRLVAAVGRNVSVETANGQIELSGQLSDTSVEAVNGRIVLRLAPGSAGGLSAETKNGIIDIEVPRGAGLTVEASSIMGKVDLAGLSGVDAHRPSGLPFLQSVHTSRPGEPRLDIRAETANGMIRVRDV
jgi:DUF4097 and DUF4098 domain-containing protein YvlB